MTADVAEFYPAAVRQALRFRVASAHDFDDLVQESVIAAWLSTRETERTDPITYGRVVGGRRIGRIVAGREPMLGSEAAPGHRVHDLARKTDRRDSSPVEDHDTSTGTDETAEAELRVDVDRVLAALAPRDRVIARGVADDLTFEEIGRLVGLSPLGARNRWKRTLVPMLRVAFLRERIVPSAVALRAA